MDILNNIELIIGPDDSLQWWHMGIRAFIIFIYSIFIIRLSNKRIFGKRAAFDIVLGIVLGSIFSRAITGNSPFFPTMFAGLVLILLHRWLGFMAAINSFGSIFKGKKRMIIENGRMNRNQMKYASLSEEDVREALRIKQGSEDFSKVKQAYLERSGDISFIHEK